MRFGFDIDDTLIGLREFAFHLYQKKLAQEVPIAAFRALNRVEIHEPFGLTDLQGKELWNGLLEEIYFTDCPPYSGAVECLQRLHAEGHEIYYITARTSIHGENTKTWMKKQGFPVQEDRFFCGMKDAEKVETIKRLQLDCYVDDKPEVLDTLVGTPVKAIVKDQSYNRELELPRIFEWADADELLGQKI
ncbi:5' nucleotidase, NT5C type [Planococcus sp. YIM B11945]|uniref:5' nucleotidase, NT5C type n=1 Tax=Planococcus sp. YIM B11945 TaxID=3435410 RepID=UPI003D7EDD54